MVGAKRSHEGHQLQITDLFPLPTPQHFTVVRDNKNETITKDENMDVLNPSTFHCRQG